MTSNEFLDYASGVVFMLGYVPYIRSVVLRLGPAPTKSTWLIWALLVAVLTAAMYKDDTLNFQIVQNLITHFTRTKPTGKFN